MEKYNRDQLRQMAYTLLQAKANDDPRYFTFIMTLALTVHTTAAYIEQMIQEYAR